MRKTRSWSIAARAGLIALAATGAVSAISNASLAFWLLPRDTPVSEAALYFFGLLETFVGFHWFLVAGANIAAAIGLAGTMVSVNRLLAIASEQTTSITGPNRGDTAWIIVGWIVPIVGVFVLPKRLAAQVDSLGVPNADAMKRLGNIFIFGLLIVSLVLRLTGALYSEAVALSTFAVVFALDAAMSLGYVLISLGMLRVVGALLQRSSMVGPPSSLP